jgi:hypothetical protein
VSPVRKYRIRAACARSTEIYDAAAKPSLHRREKCGHSSGLQ